MDSENAHESAHNGFSSDFLTDTTKDGDEIINDIT
jgi:hypothetical protein